MNTRPTRIAQTTSEAKKQYKQNGQQISELEQRQLERGLELDQRAARLREQEERKRIAKKKKEARERKERETRRHLNVGLATQLARYNHTQKQLKIGMEEFLGLKKQRSDKSNREAEIQKKLEAIAEAVDKEPWDSPGEDNIDFVAPSETVSMPGASSPVEDDLLIDDDLDDDTLLEVHDQVMSESDQVMSNTLENPEELQSDVSDMPSLKAVPTMPMHSVSTSNFIRVHGPVNAVVDNILDRLPGSLVEFLSTDLSLNLPAWNANPSLLHKLNPIGMPPHRLRLKVGSTLILLKDLNLSSQLSKSSQLKVLRTENDRLECQVLDGELAGTKTILTRVAFSAKYRNDDRLPFQRLQFPVRVCTASPISGRPSSNSSAFRIPALPRHSQIKKSAAPVVKATDVQKPISKSDHSLSAAKPSAVSSKTSVIDCGWDDFIESATQIARELSSDDPTGDRFVHPKKITEVVPPGTPDYGSSPDDLQDIDLVACLVTPVKINKRPSLKVSATDEPLSKPRKTEPSLRSQSSTEIANVSLTHPRQRHHHLQRRSSVQRPTPLSERLQAQATVPALPPLSLKPPIAVEELRMSTQEVASFFDDDDF